MLSPTSDYYCTYSCITISQLADLTHGTESDLGMSGDSQVYKGTVVICFLLVFSVLSVTIAYDSISHVQLWS